MQSSGKYRDSSKLMQATTLIVDNGNMFENGKNVGCILCLW